MKIVTYRLVIDFWLVLIIIDKNWSLITSITTAWPKQLAFF